MNNLIITLKSGKVLASLSLELNKQGTKEGVFILHNGQRFKESDVGEIRVPGWQHKLVRTTQHYASRAGGKIDSMLMLYKSEKV